MDKQTEQTGAIGINITKPYFCPRCHKLIQIPTFLKTRTVRVEKGVTLKCGYCKRGEVCVK